MQEKESSFKKNYVWYALLEAVVFAMLLVLDLIVKHMTEQNININESIPLINGFIAITYTKNTGAAFSLLSNSFHFLLIVRLIMSIAMACFLVFYHRKLPMLLRISMCLIMAGAVGNLCDQIRFGYVRDMFEFQFIKFAVFNVADISIIFGVIVLSLGMITNKELLSDKKAKTNTE